MKRIIFFLMISIALLSCNRKLSEGNSTQMPHTVEITGFDDENTVPISSLISGFRGVQLESTPKCMLSGVQKIEVIDSLILVSDMNKVAAFTRDGKFSHTYGKSGNAENEYLALGTFMQTPTGEIALIDTATGKILLFTLSGKFISSKKFSDNSFSRVQDGCYVDKDKLFLSLSVYNNQNSVYGYFDMEDGSFTDIANVYMQTDNVMQYIGKHPYCKFGDDIHWVMPFSPVISSLNPDGNTYEFKTSKKIWGKTELEQVKDFSIMTYAKAMEEGVFMGFTDIFETENYLWLPCTNLYCTVVDKASNTCKNISIQNSISCTEFPLFSIATISNNQLICAFPMTTLLSGFTIGETADKNLLKLKELLSNVDNNGNPILLFYELK